jgi:hypothetical protein
LAEESGFQSAIGALKAAVANVVVGQESVVEEVLICLLAWPAATCCSRVCRASARP